MLHPIGHFLVEHRVTGSSVMCHWLENPSWVEVGEALTLARIQTDCRCAVLRAPAGVLKVSRNFKQSDLLLVIPPQAEGRVHSIRVMHPPCRHKRFVPQHLFERREQVTALLMQLLARRLLPGIGSGSGLPGGEH